MVDYEKLGLFYLGREAADEGDAPHYLYESKDLATHAVILGMTGSGKTGLGITLLEEAAIDGIPVIAIDPKGDLGNLLLTFPNLKPQDFKPWIDPSVASIAGQTVDEYATALAETTRQGLAGSDETPERIAKFADAAERTIYTPGSNAGVPLTVLKSFTAPPQELMEDAESLRDKIAASAAGLLSLVGVTGDPLTSREHVLVSTILDQTWGAGRDLGIAQLIQEIQKPPFNKVGVFDLETFYPAKDRVELAMRLNNLLAAPAFAGWLEGESLNVDRLLHTADGKPRLSILSISHLSEAERMFFVTLLLGEVLSWTRKQSGTSTLRAILYMDEVAGYFPPVSEPPSKQPMLTLLKQARAYGLGIVLATQNPVDLDYKGLSNTGTWFLGRLQTERDKARVLEGLEGLEGASTASGAKFDRGEIEAILAGLSSREFLVNNVHEDAPIVIYTRWALSYLRGPLTRDQIATLMADRKSKFSESAPPATAIAAEATETAPPNFPPDVREYLLDAEAGTTDAASFLWRPAVIGRVKMHFTKRGKASVDCWSERAFLMPVEETGGRWDDAETINTNLIQPAGKGDPNGKRGSAPSDLLNAESYEDWTKSLKDYAYRTQFLMLSHCDSLDLISKAGETEGEFRIRLGQLAREARDREIEKLRDKFGSKVKTIEKRLRTAEARVDREAEQASRAKWDSWLSLGSGIMGALFGRKTFSRTNINKATSAMRGFGRSRDQSGDVERAVAKVRDLETDMEELKTELEAEVERITNDFDPQAIELETVELSPRKSDLQTAPASVLWCPWKTTTDGFMEPGWKRGR